MGTGIGASVQTAASAHSLRNSSPAGAPRGESHTNIRGRRTERTVGRWFIYLVVVGSCLTVTAAALQASLTADFLAWLSALGAALVSNLAVQFVLVGGAVLGLLSLCALSWDKAERRYREHEARLAEAARWEAARRDTSSLLDDSPGALPEEWQPETGRYRGHGDAA